MKEKVLCALILAAGIVGLGLCIKSPIDKIANKGREVTAMGRSEKTVKADVATWNASFSMSGDDVQSLYSEVSEMSETIKKHLAGKGIPATDIEVTSPDINDSGEYDYNHRKNENRYSVIGHIHVVTDKVSTIDKIEKNRGDFFTEYGYIIDTDVEYEYKGFQELKSELMAQAIKNAQKTAQQLADNSNSKLDKIKDADQGYFDIESSEKSPMYKVISGVTHITYTLKD